MKQFGIIKTFDQAKGFGVLTPEKDGRDLPFNQSALQWQRSDSPKVKQRLSYEEGTDKNGNPCAVNLQPA